ncbi:TPA: hypothetical protein IGZ64_004212 [Escherichia coli]|nr:hypothetical protein [Escherichia coli]
MNDSVIVFSCQWPVTAAVAALTEPACSGPVIPVYTQQALETALQKHRKSVVILGLNPHEYVCALHHLHSLLKGRRLLFISRKLYWTDHVLPYFWGLDSCQFCSLDDFYAPYRRRAILKQVMSVNRKRQAGRESDNIILGGAPVKGRISLAKINIWLERQQRDTGLIGREISVLQTLVDGKRPEMDAQRISHFKKRGLEKLQMSLHVMNLYRGIQLRAELQASLPQEERDTDRERRE